VYDKVQKEDMLTPTFMNQFWFNEEWVKYQPAQAPCHFEYIGQWIYPGNLFRVDKLLSVTDTSVYEVIGDEVRFIRVTEKSLEFQRFEGLNRVPFIILYEVGQYP
jgi:hypothetical protein